MSYSYRTMPKSTASVPGMKMLAGDTENLRVSFLPDIVYACRDGHELHLHIMTPVSADRDDDPRRWPVLVHIQGSAWMKQDLNNHVFDLKEIAAAGYLVVIVEYRDSSIAKLPAQVYDAKDAVRFVAEHIEELKGDVQRMYVSGDSSGGHIALLCWATWQRDLLDETGGSLPDIRAFIDLYGVCDLVTMADEVSSIRHDTEDSPEGKALGGAPAVMKEEAARVNVLNYLDPGVKNAPLLIMHGNKDRLVPFAQSVMLYEACMKTGKDADFWCVDNADHGGAVFYCPAVYKVILDFLAEH